MRRFNFEEKKVYLVTIVYDHANITPRKVVDNFKQKYPEFADCNYDDEIVGIGKSKVMLYREKCSDFVEVTTL